jgi:hypothetical protein
MVFVPMPLLIEYVFGAGASFLKGLGIGSPMLILGIPSLTGFTSYSAGPGSCSEPARNQLQPQIAIRKPAFADLRVTIIVTIVLLFIDS